MQFIESDLQDAIYNCDDDRIIKIVNRKSFDPEKHYNKGLYYSKIKFDTLKALVDKGLEPIKSVTKGYLTPLFIHANDADSVKLLLECGLDVNAICSYTKQTAAFKTTNKDSIEHFIVAGLDIEVVDKQGKTCITPAMIDVLLDRDSCRDYLVSHIRFIAFNSVFFGYRMREIMNIYIENGYDINDTFRDYHVREYTLLGMLIDNLDKSKSSDVLTSTIQLLIDLGIDVNKVNTVLNPKTKCIKICTPLYLLFRDQNNDNIHERSDIAQLLLTNGAHV